MSELTREGVRLSLVQLCLLALVLKVQFAETDWQVFSRRIQGHQLIAARSLRQHEVFLARNLLSNVR